MKKNIFKFKIINKTDEYELFRGCKEYIKYTITQMVDAFIRLDSRYALIYYYPKKF